MNIQQNFIAYQESITEELKAARDRIRNLIGEEHWLTDGEHKEAVLRKVLHSYLPESVRIGKGFVCYPRGFANLDTPDRASSGQIDILLTSRNKPTLFKDGDLVIVTADAVEALIEVKTRLYRRNNHETGIATVLTNLAQKAKDVRQNSRQKRCLAGLFVYQSDSEIDHRYLLEKIQEASQGDSARVVDYIAFGPDTFVRFWENGEQNVNSPIAGPVWHSYRLQNLAQTYFINNIVFSLSADIPSESQIALFPLEGGKENRRCYYISLASGQAEEFP
jgi:hypothetical protein